VDDLEKHRGGWLSLFTRGFIKMPEKLFEAARVSRMHRLKVPTYFVDAISILTSKFHNVGFVTQSPGG
jgi:hypothetical protein